MVGYRNILMYLIRFYYSYILSVLCQNMRRVMTHHITQMFFFFY